MNNKIKKNIIILKFFTKNIFYLIYIYFVLPCFIKILPTYTFFYRRYINLFRKINLKKEFNFWQSQKNVILKNCKNGYKLNIDDFGFNQKELEKIKKSLENKKELIIGEIDQDGLIYSYYGPINGIETISKENFFKKTRFKIDLIVFKNIIAVKKIFGTDKIAFLNEINALYNLNLSKCNVPTILNIDFKNLSITLSFIPGDNLEQKLVKIGALMRDNDIKKNKKLMAETREKRCLWYIQEGKRFLSVAVDSQTIEDIFKEIKKIHKNGFELYDIKYDKIIIEKNTHKIFLIDFDSATNFIKKNKKIFSVMRDRDIEKFNLYFNEKKLTYKRIRKIIKNKKIPYFEYLYSPVYFGYGLKIGKIWDINSGFGRWNFILEENLSPLKNKRILSLGVNNGFNELQMLRNGAKEVVGIEKDQGYIKQGKFIKEVFEWADNDIYNFKYMQMGMEMIIEEKLGKFDIVTALCSIYYLDDGTILNLIKHLNNITDKIILQCNIRKNIGRKNNHEYEKASIIYNENLLKLNGFSDIKIIAPLGYSRPLLIGKK